MNGPKTILGSDTMTPRQIQVLRELRKGKCNKEIARTLKISVPTVKLHLTAVFNHLGVYTRVQAIAKAGYIDEGGKPPTYLSDQDLLAEFANVTIENPDTDHSHRIIKFARRVLERTQAP